MLLNVYFYSTSGIGIHYYNKSGKLVREDRTDILLGFFSALRTFCIETGNELEALFLLGKFSTQLVFLPSSHIYILALETTRVHTITSLQLYLEGVRDAINTAHFNRMRDEMFFSDIANLHRILENILNLNLKPLLKND